MGRTPDSLSGVCQRHGVVLLLQFGSTVSGPVRPDSDVDLAALLSDPELSFERFGELQHDVQQLFENREIDLSIINRADPLFLKKILERCQLLYGSARRLQELRIYAFKRYQDHRRYLAQERRYVARRLAAERP
jgi:predicted nucleotidyltransferase